MYDLSNKLDSIKELKQIYSNGNRYYIDDSNMRYMSVTSMLSGNTEDVISAWRERVGDKEADAVSAFTSKVGTNVHKMVEDYIQNKEVDYSSLLASSIFSSFKLELRHISNIRAIELSMYSHSLKLAGTCDLICDYKGELSLIDHKTSKYPKKVEWLENYFLQATCYVIMFKELYGINIKNLVLFIGCRDGEFQVAKSTPEKHLKRVIESNRKFNPLFK